MSREELITMFNWLDKNFGLNKKYSFKFDNLENTFYGYLTGDNQEVALFQISLDWLAELIMESNNERN